MFLNTLPFSLYFPSHGVAELLRGAVWRVLALVITQHERALGFPHPVPTRTAAVTVPRPPEVGSFALEAVSTRTEKGTGPALKLLGSKSVR